MTKYQALSKEELLQILEKKDKELARKYGIFWDAEKIPEKVVVDCEENLPVLERLKEKEIKTGENANNILIEGDNYHALTVLNYTHKEKIDLIYIDPPYNTGNRDFVYNDSFVDPDDEYRHSKWLNFMDKRMKLAKNLLREDGFLAVSIDDNELAQLKLLCDSIFGEENFISNISIKMSHLSGVKMSHKDKKPPKIKESLLIYSKNKAKLSIQSVFEKVSWDKAFARYKLYLLTDENDPNNLKKWHTISLKQAMINNNVDIENEEAVNTFCYNNSQKIFRTARNKAILKMDFPKDNEFREIVTTTGLKKIIFKKEEVLFANTKIKEENGEISAFEPLGDLWLDIGINNLHNEGGVPFKNGKKPLKLINRILKMKPKTNAIILDFFAGSGTTGHSVLELNKKDGGNRTFILCTYGKENGSDVNIANDFCYLRIKNATSEYGGNIQYFKTDFVKRVNNRDQIRFNLVNKCTDMLCVKEGIFELYQEKSSYKIFVSNDKTKYLCIYYNFTKFDVNEFVEKVSKLEGQKQVYIFSETKEPDLEPFYQIKECNIEAIPEPIFEIYEELIKLNK